MTKTMWKSLLLPVVRLVALTLLIVSITFTPALAQETAAPEATNIQPPEVVNPNPVDVPVPDQPKTEDTTEVPTSQRQSNPRLATPQSRNPYDMQAIEEFNQELYGKGN